MFVCLHLKILLLKNPVGRRLPRPPQLCLRVQRAERSRKGPHAGSPVPLGLTHSSVCIPAFQRLPKWGMLESELGELGV